MDDYSDSSFQIPVAASSSSNFLLADENSDFLEGTDITLATPAIPTRTRTDDALTLAELTPRPRTRTRTRSSSSSRMPVRRSPRKDKTTPAVPSPLKRVVESDLSAAMEDTLSPFKRTDRSFQIPSMSSAGMDLLMVDDSGDMLRATGDVSFGDTPLAPALASKALTLSQLTSPPKASPPRTTIRTPSPTAEEDVPEISTPAIPGGSAADIHGKIPPRSPASPFRIPGAEVEALVVDDEEQSRLPEPSQSTPFTVPAEAHVHSVPQPGASVDKIDGSLASGEGSPTGVAEAGPPVPRRNSNRRSSQVKTQSTAVTSGGLVKPLNIRPRASSAAPSNTAPTQKTKPLRRPRAASAAPQGTPTAGPSLEPVPSERNADGVSELNTRNALAAAPRAIPSTAANDGYTGDPLAPPAAQGTVDAPSDAARDPSPHKETLPECEARMDTDGTPPALGPVAEERDTPPDSPAPDVAINVEQAPVPAAPPSPMRRGTKRSAGNDEPERARRKRTRTAPSMTGPAAKRSVRVLRSSRLKHAKAGQPSNGPRTAGSTASRGTRHLTASTRDEAASNAHPDANTGHDVGARRGAPTSSNNASSSRTMGQSGGARVPIAQRLTASLPPAKPTQPRAFLFRSDARIDARHGARAPSPAVAIPDFAALHAAHAHALAARRPAVAPTVPLEIPLQTEARAAEREKFEQARRAREAEAERVREEERRRREEEEEREVREMRRRAVPRANEVPGWYAHAPRRAHQDEAKT